tara:strand:+ start:286 stop:474 length:189 start_codon:yes stop_codon:yes gene_type:complete
MEPGNTPLQSTLEVKKEKKLPYITPILMFLGVIAATLSVIVAGYFHGNMHIEAVYKSITQFT